jgi:hypothetical protein
MPLHQPTTTPRSPQRARRAAGANPAARRVGFALPTVREVPRRSVRELATW